MLTRQKEQFSEVFYLRHRRHVVGVLRRIVMVLTFSGIVAAISIFTIFEGTGSAGFTSAATAVFLYFAWAGIASVPDLFRGRVLPYFERRLGGAQTWLAGESLLWNSRRLDAAAAALGVRPLSEFASGDDMVSGERLCWFSPEEALLTAERLIQPDAAVSLPAGALSDLTFLRDALRLASSQGVRFCLLLREGNSASAYEMDLRQGSFF
jgi:hypothetical protein